MKARRVLLFALVVGLCWIPSLSFAQRLSLQTAFPPVAYGPDARTSSSGVIRVQSSTYAGTVTVILTQLSFGPVPAAPNSAPKYGFYKPSANPLYQLDLGGAPTSANQVLGGNLALDAAKKVHRLDLDFALLVEGSPLPPPGTYTIQLKADLYNSGFPVSGRVIDTLSFSATISVGTFFDIAILPAGSAFSIDATSYALSFGTASPGASIAADLVARSNVAYSISASSTGGGYLKPPDQADPSALPYALSCDGLSLSLAGGARAPVASGAATGYAGMRRRLGATILPWQGLPTEGSYSDLITFTISAP